MFIHGGYIWRAGLLAGLAMMLSSMALADPVKIRASTHDGYGRIDFAWPSAVPFAANTANGRMTIRFGRPIEANFQGVARKLGKYLRSVEAGGDGRSVILNLKGDFDISSFDIGAAVVVEIADKTPDEPAANDQQANAPETRAQSSAPTGSGPTVPVRTGVHKDYTRIVFDWPKSVPYKIRRDGAETTIDFSVPGNLKLGALQSRPPKYVSSVRSGASGGGVSVSMTIPETSRVRHFLSGPKVVFDVMAPGTRQVAETKKAKESTPSPENKVPATANQPDNATGSVAAKTTATPPKGSSKTADAPKKEASGKASASTGAGSLNELANTGDEKPKALSPPTQKKQGKNAEEAAKKFAGIEGVKIAGAGGAASAGAAPAASAVTTDPNAIGIRIDWDEPVAAAVFRRVGNLWVVFDKPAKMDVENLRAAAGNIIRGIEQLPNDRATVLKMKTVTGINPTMKRNGLAWILEFRQQPLRPAKPVQTTPQPNSPVGARIFVSITEPGGPVVVNDPDVGDNLIVVPVVPLGYGIANLYDYPQVRVLPSGQGLVIQPKTDDLKVRPLRQGVELMSGSGMKVSSVTPRVAAASKLGDKSLFGKFTRLFDLEKWKKTNVETFNDDRQRYTAVAALASKSKKEKARLDLARFFFANGYGPETLGILRVLEEERPAISDSDEFKGLSGAANLMMGRFDEAREFLEDEALEENDEGRFWRAALRAYEDDLFGAAAELRRMGAIMRRYPDPLKIPLGTLVAEAAIELGDIEEAQKYLESVRTSNPTPSQANQLDFVEGRLRELSGDFDGAVGKWEEVQEGPHRPSRAKAAVARVELLLKLKSIDELEAIEELEKLRFAWRGDNFEFNLLRRLGDLYLEAGDYRNGLRTLRQAATHFRDYEEAPEVTQKMTDSFANLYLEDEADVLPPITAIALYDEFKELTPPGELGDEMIRKLADRLVDVDLLDRAADLLQAQVEFRLEGEEKARVGSQLALVHLIAKKYGDALATLDETEVANITEDLSTQRRHLRAKAMIGQELTEEALTLLKTDKSTDADLLRTEIYWGEGDWVQTSQALQRLVRGYGAKPGMALSDRQSQTILNLAITMTLAGNERGVDRLQRDYGGAMDNTLNRDAFRLIASPKEPGLINYPSIAGKVAKVENFQNFLSEYQERLKEQNLSSIN